MKKLSIIVAVGLVAVALLWVGFRTPSYALITNYDECAAAGYPIMESYPERCATPDGRTFTRVIAYPIYTQAHFGVPVTLAIDEAVQFEDGLIVTLRKIDDSRCKPNVQCIWAGELAAFFDVGAAGARIHLGTVNNTVSTYDGHTFELKDVTERYATLGVSLVASL